REWCGGMAPAEGPPPSELRPHAWPTLPPPTAAQGAAEREHGVHVLPCPVHATPLEPCLHEQLIGALDGATAARITRRLALGIVQLRATFLPVAHHSTSQPLRFLRA